MGIFFQERQPNSVGLRWGVVRAAFAALRSSREKVFRSRQQPLKVACDLLLRIRPNPTSRRSRRRPEGSWAPLQRQTAPWRCVRARHPSLPRRLPPCIVPASHLALLPCCRHRPNFCNVYQLLGQFRVFISPKQKTGPLPTVCYCVMFFWAGGPGPQIGRAGAH